MFHLYVSFHPHVANVTNMTNLLIVPALACFKTSYITCIDWHGKPITRLVATCGCKPHAAFHALFHSRPHSTKITIVKMEWNTNYTDFRCKNWWLSLATAMGQWLQSTNHLGIIPLTYLQRGCCEVVIHHWPRIIWLVPVIASWLIFLCYKQWYPQVTIINSTIEILSCSWW